jgi:GT2 family glycosyltransferase
MTSSPLTLSAIVCCYSFERWPLLVRAIDSLRVQRVPVQEIIVVVDHNEALLKKVKDEFPTVTVVPNEHDQGLSGARDSGVEHATCDILAFIDDDAECEPDWAQRILEAYVDDEILGVGGRVLPRFENRRPQWFPREFDWAIGCTYEGHRSSRGPVRNLIGANMSIRRSVFAKVGGFHRDLGRTAVGAAGCEETELCVRASAVLGGVFWYEPAAVATHFVPESRATHHYFRRRCLDEGASKATIARLSGKSSGLASERRYLAHTIPLAILREAIHMLLLRPGAAGRLAALVSGVAFTVFGYLRGLARRPSALRRDDFDPILVATLDVDAPGELPQGLSPSGRPYGRAQVLVKSHEAPLAIVPLSLRNGSFSKDEVDLVFETLRRQRAEQPVGIGTARHHEAAELPCVSVIIATRVRPELLERTLQSVQRLDYERFEVVVVDNGSTSASTRECVERLAVANPRLRYVSEPRAGLARAHNRGLQAARGEIVAFTDDDVIVDRGWLRALVEAFETDENVACVTGLIVPPELETIAQWWTECFFGLSKGLQSRRFDLDRFLPSDPLFPFAAGRLGSGANMAFRASRLRSLGGFVPALGTGTPARGGDDLAAFFHVLVSGNALVYEPRAIVHHEHRRPYDDLRRQAYGYGVGLGAYLTHVAITYPTLARRALTLTPRAARYAFSKKSVKNAGRDHSIPRELAWLERRGLAAGPIAYARSRIVTRRDRWSFDIEAPEPARVPVESRK